MPNHIDVVKPIADKPDDLFICASGVGSLLQRVSYGIANKKCYKADLAMIVDYHEPLPDKKHMGRGLTWQKYFNSRNDSNFKDIKAHLESSDKDMVIAHPIFSRGNAFSNNNMFKTCLEIMSLEEKVGNVTIDITGFPDEDILPMLYVLDNPANTIRLLYAEPPAGTLPKGFGVLKKGTVPHFDGDVHYRCDNSQDVAVFILGYDSFRLYSLDDHVKSHDTILIFPNPSLNKNWNNLSKRMNYYAARFVYPKYKKEVSEVDPLAIKDSLDEVYSSYPINDSDGEKRWYMYVGLAGCTKWPVVGAYLFARDKMEKVEGFKENEFPDHSPVGIYYSTSFYDKPLDIRGSRISEFVLPKKEIRV